MVEPRHATNVCRDLGEHRLSGRVWSVVSVVTRYEAYGSTPWGELTDGQRESWLKLLDDIHSARVELERLPHEHRERATDLLDGVEGDNLADVPGVIRRAISETVGAGR